MKYSAMYKGLVTAGLLSCGSLAVAGEEVPIELSALPEEVMAKAQKVMPCTKFVSANTEQDGRRLVYEIQGTDMYDRKVEVDLYESGRVQEIELEFKLESVPGAVLKKVQDAYPGIIFDYIEASHSASMKVVQYEFVGKVDGSQIDLEVSADGRKIKVSDQ